MATAVNSHIDKWNSQYPTPLKAHNVQLPYLYEIAQGRVVNHHALNKFGFNSDVGTSYETVCDAAASYVYATTAETLNIVSTSANDGAGDESGAETVQIYGLDANYVEQNEIVTLNGDTDVTTVNTYIRLFRMIVRSAGSGGTAVGTITAKDPTNTRTYAQITIGMNQTLMALWTVPANHVAYLTHFYAGSSVVTKATRVGIFIRPFGEVFQVKRLLTINNSHEMAEWKMPLQITQKTDVEIRALAVGGSGVVAAGFDLWHETS